MSIGKLALSLGSIILIGRGSYLLWLHDPGGTGYVITGVVLFWFTSLFRE